MFCNLQVSKWLIVHGEQEITYLNSNGEIQWNFSGRDIFTTADGNEDFIILEDCILAVDWEGNNYKINRDGKEIND